MTYGEERYAVGGAGVVTPPQPAGRQIVVTAKGLTGMVSAFAGLIALAVMLHTNFFLPNALSKATETAAQMDKALAAELGKAFREALSEHASHAHKSAVTTEVHALSMQLIQKDISAIRNMVAELNKKVDRQ